jgi:hypothetical protein
MIVLAGVDYVGCHGCRNWGDEFFGDEFVVFWVFSASSVFPGRLDRCPPSPLREWFGRYTCLLSVGDFVVMVDRNSINLVTSFYFFALWGRSPLGYFVSAAFNFRGVSYEKVPFWAFATCPIPHGFVVVCQFEILALLSKGYHRFFSL